MGSDYGSYDEVPVYRRQWFFWLTFFFINPIALLILISGEVYYVKGGEVRAFGIVNRIVALLLGIALLNRILSHH
jgi:hypothetical protein